MKNKDLKTIAIILGILLTWLLNAWDIVMPVLIAFMLYAYITRPADEEKDEQY